MPRRFIAVRLALLVLFATLAVASLIDLVGGPDLLGEAQLLVFGVLCAALFGIDLRRRPASESLWLNWAGFVSGVLIIVAYVADLFF